MDVAGMVKPAGFSVRLSIDYFISFFSSTKITSLKSEEAFIIFLNSSNVPEKYKNDGKEIINVKIGRPEYNTKFKY